VDDKGRIAKAFGVPREALQSEIMASAIEAERLRYYWRRVFLPTIAAIHRMGWRLEESGWIRKEG